MIEPDKLALWSFVGFMGFASLCCFLRAFFPRRRHGSPDLLDKSCDLLAKSRHLQDAKDIIIMALLDDIAAQAAAIEATDAAAAAKIDDLTSRLAAANAAIDASKGDVDAANALAARLKAANDALQAKVAA